MTQTDSERGLLAGQRRAAIVREVRERGGVRVTELVDRFRVSDMTIRRDLDALARAGQLEKVLASMPLRIWRTDQVTVLAPHANDPGQPQGGLRPDEEEFLTEFIRAVPAGTPQSAVAQAEAGEKRRTAELGQQGHLLRLWRLPEAGHALGLWRAAGPAELQELVRTLPLDPYMTTDTTPLTNHPSDPVIAAR